MFTCIFTIEKRKNEDTCCSNDRSHITFKYQENVLRVTSLDSATSFSSENHAESTVARAVYALELLLGDIRND